MIIMATNKNQTLPTLHRCCFLMWLLLLWMISFSFICCHDFIIPFDHHHINNNNRIHHQDDNKIVTISPIVDKRPALYNHHHHHHEVFKPLQLFDDVVHYESYNDGFNRKTHDVMLTGDDRLLQVSTIECVHNESDIRLAISNAPNFPNTSTKINFCSSYIFINASKPNKIGTHGILIRNKFLEFNCVTNSSNNNCILDMQSLSRLFYVRNSILVFYDIDFINGNGFNGIVYNDFDYNGGVFNVRSSSTIKMINCGFSYNTAMSGGSMFTSDSTIKMMSSNNNTIRSAVVQNNIAADSGGFLIAYNSIIEIDKYNFINNTAQYYGGAILIFDSTFTLFGNDNPTLPSVIQNNIAEFGFGGFIDAYDSIIEIDKYNFINNTAQWGGAIFIRNSTFKLFGSDDPTFPSIIQNNIANRSGGFLFADINSATEIYKYNSVNNTAGYGGVIYMNSNSSLALFDCFFRNNLANVFGGGALFLYSSTTILENIVFENNLAEVYGGAIIAVGSINSDDGMSTLVMKNVILSNNTSLENKESIVLAETKISLDRVSFSQSLNNVESNNFLVATFNEDDNDYRKSSINLPSSPPPQKKKPAPQQTCITTRTELQEAVNNCDEKTIGKSCGLDLCEGRLQMNSSSNVNGINISNKNIVLNCQKICPTKRCVLDGLGISRMFSGLNYNFKVQNIIFVNGFHPDDGGSIRGDSDSVLTIINCSFVNNTAPFGSAVIVNNSKLTIEGMETNFVNNSGVGPPIQVLSSQLNISNAICAGNNASKYDSAILMYNSTIEVSDFHFLRSTTTKQQRDLASVANVFVSCDVYVSVDADDFSNKFSCMDLEKTNKSFPVIDVSDGCPTSSPVTASPIMSPSALPSSFSAMPSPLSSTTKTYPPVSTPLPVSTPSPVSTPPKHTICFSGENLVEVKNIGYIPMRDIKIGDFVKSANDVYSQIYGFGHFDHDQDATYLRFSFDRNGSSHTSQNVASLLEISPKHLVFVDNMNNKQRYIRAADVVVGDILSGKRIKSIITVVRRGVYAPLTHSGDIIVNGILASNYVDVLEYQVPWNQHTWGHFIFTPQRLFCYYCMETCTREIYINGYGILAYLIVVMSSIINGLQLIIRVCLRF